MKTVAAVVAVLLGSACSDNVEDVIVGPFAGTTHRFAVDRIGLPSSSSEAHAFGVDLDGNKVIDNQLGMTIGTLGSQGDVTSDGADMIASGVLASTVVVQTDDLESGARVGVRYFGAGIDGDAAVAVGGRFVAGTFESNRALSSSPGQATFRLPVFLAAAPSEIHARAFQIALAPDADGHGGYTGVVAAAIAFDEVMPPIVDGISAMIVADPQGHNRFARILDADHDGTITAAEIRGNSLIQALVMSDVMLRDGTPAVSLGFQIHLTPCESGTCVTTPPIHTCGDRILDGDETDLDCGGSCGACPGLATCAVAADCQSHACGADHACAAPSCRDGVLDGFESAVDCGGGACTGCAVGLHCLADTDCASGHCDVSATETCQ